MAQPVRVDLVECNLADELGRDGNPVQLQVGRPTAGGALQAAGRTTFERKATRPRMGSKRYLARSELARQLFSHRTTERAHDADVPKDVGARFGLVQPEQQ